jgi:hypothetical protein
MNRKLALLCALAGQIWALDSALDRYDAEASFGGQTLARATTIHAGDRHPVVLDFDVPADLLPKAQEAAKQ